MDFHVAIEINDYWWLWVHGSMGRYCFRFRLHAWPMVDFWRAVTDDMWLHTEEN